MKRIIRVDVKELPDSIYFSVTDNGKGIDPEIAGKNFPAKFFNQKEKMNPENSKPMKAWRKSILEWDCISRETMLSVWVAVFNSNHSIKRLLK